MNDNTLYVAYILCCIAAILVIYALPIFDFRGVSKVRRKRARIAADESEFSAQPEQAEHGLETQSDGWMIIPRADLLALVSALTLLSVAWMSMAGFLGPRLIDQLLTQESIQPLSEWAWSAPLPLERLAQITGALSFGLIALRLVRPLLAVTGLILATAFLIESINFILERPLLF